MSDHKYEIDTEHVSETDQKYPEEEGVKINNPYTVKTRFTTTPLIRPPLQYDRYYKEPNNLFFISMVFNPYSAGTPLFRIATRL